jgi:hypothetical protein
VGEALGFGFDLWDGLATGFGFGRGVADGEGLLTGCMSSRAWMKRRFFSSSLVCPRIAAGVSKKHPTQIMMATRFRFRTPQANKRGRIFKSLNK